VKQFIQKHEKDVIGVLSGFDRLVLRGTLRGIVYPEGMKRYLWAEQVLLKDFKKHVLATTKRVAEAASRVALAAGRPIKYLPSPKDDKEEIARAFAEKDGIVAGHVATLRCVEPCRAISVRPNRETKKLEPYLGDRFCQHYYHYLIHPLFGWMNVRIETWFPFTITICLNGREWLSREMDKAKLHYERWENSFAWIEDFDKAQRLMDKQLAVNWPTLLNRLAHMINPAHDQIFRKYPVAYYWTAHQSEWATDITFRDRASLDRIYPALIHHGMTTFSSPDVMRFLGRPVPASGKVHRSFAGEVISDLKDRQEGVRIKHSIEGNSLKLYDKWVNLRGECTMNNAKGFKVYRPKEGDEHGELAWRDLRKGIADLHRRTQVSHAAINRYLDAMAAVDETTPLRDLAKDLCRPTSLNGTRMRALNPWSPEDGALLKAVNHGEFTIKGFRNRDIRQLLFASKPESKKEERRRSGVVTRKLRLLRAHGLIAKIQKSHSYQLTEKGRIAITPLLSAREANTAELTKLAA
jgi:hypothetical protein